MPAILRSNRLGSARRQLVGAIAVAALMGAGLILRWQIAQEPLWLDELHSAWTIDDGVGSIVERASEGNQPPVYFWLLSAVTAFAGFNPIGLRLLSLACGLGVIALAGGWVWKTTHSWLAAGLTVFLIAFDSGFLFYATEARPYALVQWLGMLQAAFFWWTWQRFTWPRAIGWGTLSIALFHCHYTAASLVVAEAITLLVAPRLIPVIPGGAPLRWDRRGWIVAAVVAIVCLLTSAPHLATLLERKGNWDSLSSPLAVLWDGLPQWILLGVPAFLLWNRERSPRRSGPPRELLLFGLAWGLVPGLLVILLDLLQLAPLALTRYTVVGSVAFPLLIGWALGSWSSSTGQVAKSTSRFQWALAAAILVVSVAGNRALWSDLSRGDVPRYRHENWKAVIEAVNKLEPQAGGATERSPLFCFANILEDAAAFTNTDPRFQRYLLFPVTGIYAVDESRFELIPGPTLADDPLAPFPVDAFANRPRVLMLVRAHPPRIAFLIDELLQRAGPGREVRRFQSPDNLVTLISIE